MCLLWAMPTEGTTRNCLGCANCQDDGAAPCPRVSLCWQTGCCPQRTSSRAAARWCCAKPSPVQRERPGRQSPSLVWVQCFVVWKAAVFILKLVFTFNLPRSSGAFTEEFACCCLRYQQMNVQACPAFVIL